MISRLRANLGVLCRRFDAAAVAGVSLPLIVGSAFVAVLIVVTGLLGWRYYTDRMTDDARTDAVNAAKSAAISMLAYDYNTADATLNKAADNLTGDFKGEFRDLIKTVIIPGAQQKQLTVHIDVRAAAAVDASPDSATVLLFINQSTTDQGSMKAVIGGARVRMRMRKDDGRWLVSSLQPI